MRLARSPWPWLGGILTLAVALRLVLLVGYANVDPWDDTLYLELAKQTRDGVLQEVLESQVSLLERGQAQTASTFIMRRGTYLPVAVSQYLFGVNELSSALPSLLASLGSIVMTYCIGCRLAGSLTGLLAALIHALVPLDLVLSTRILADAPQAFWLTASVAAVCEAARGKWSKPGRQILYGIAGLSLFLSFFTKMNGLIGLPLLFLAAAPAFRQRRTRWEPLSFLIALGVALTIDCSIFLALTGHFLLVFELELTAARALLEVNPEVVFSPLPGLAVHCSYLEGTPHHFFKLFFGTVDHYGGLEMFTAHAPLAVAALLYAGVRRQLSLPVFWVVGVFMYVQYGFRDLQWEAAETTLHYFLNANPPRYLALMLSPLCLLAGWLVTEINRLSRVAAVTTLILVGWLSIHHAVENYRFYRSSLEDVRQAGRFLMRQGDATVYTDEWCLKQLRVLSGGRLEDVRLLRDETAPPPGTWVVIGGSRGFDIPVEAVTSTLPGSFASVYLEPTLAPPSWEPVFRRLAPEHPSRGSDLFVFHVRTTD